jgi:hypothetical protein
VYKFLQYPNKLGSSIVTDLGITISLIGVYAKAACPIFVTFLGIKSSVITVFANASLPIISSSSGNKIFLRDD